VKVTEPNPGGNPARRAVVELAYGQTNDCSNAPCDYLNGRLQTATRHNRDAVLGGDVSVAETYGYKDGAGRLTDLSTAVGSTASFNGANFSHSQTWDDLGGIASVVYPTTANASSPSRTVTNGFTNGLLTSVGTYASSITYRANGILASVTHGSGGSA